MTGITRTKYALPFYACTNLADFKKLFDARKPYASQTRIVQKNVTGEADDEFYGVPQDQRMAPLAITDVAPSLVSEAGLRPSQPQGTFAGVESEQHTEESIIEPETKAETVDAGRPEQRKFSAPHLEWDATK